MNISWESSGYNEIPYSRSLACLWIVVLHTNIYSRFTNGSIPELQEQISKPSFLLRLLLYGFMSVDTFFVVSGFLLAFNFLNNDKLRQNIQESSWPSNLRRYFDYVLKRYLR